MEYLVLGDIEEIAPLYVGRPGAQEGGGGGSIPPTDPPGSCPCRSMFI